MGVHWCAHRRKSRPHLPYQHISILSELPDLPMRVRALPQSSPYRSTPERDRKLDTELERDMLGLACDVGSKSFMYDLVGDAAPSDIVF